MVGERSRKPYDEDVVNHPFVENKVVFVLGK